MFQRCNKACFKINKNDDIDIEKLLEKLELDNFNDFFNDLGIFFQTYNISFLSNSNNEYFIYFDILVPSLESLLIKKNHQCIFPNCNESIMDYKKNFCDNHLNSELQDVSIFDKELEQIFTNYKLQKNIYNFLKSKYNNTIFKYNNLSCDLEIVNNNIINKLTNIDLQNDMDDINFMLDNMNDEDEDELQENDSEIDDDSESDLDEELDPIELKSLLNDLQLFNKKQENKSVPYSSYVKP